MSSGIPTAVARLKMHLEDWQLEVRQLQRSIRHAEDSVDRSGLSATLMSMENTMESWKGQLMIAGSGRPPVR